MLIGKNLVESLIKKYSNVLFQYLYFSFVQRMLIISTWKDKNMYTCCLESYFVEQFTYNEII